jgi:hypothetical protein
MFVFLAAAAALAGTIALPATQAIASGEQLSATPSTGLINGDSITVSLSSASAYDGKLAYFSECGPPGTGSSPGDTAYCDSVQPGVTISNGAATGSVPAVYGDFAGTSCTEANNGTCTVAAFVDPGSSGELVKIASAPISFAAEQATTLSVTPSTGLDDGDQLTVNLANVPNGPTTVNILECHGDVPVTFAQTYNNCNTLVYDGAITNHAYSGSIRVAYGPIFAASPAGPICDETANGHCLIAAVDNDDNVLGSTAISFEAPPVSMTVTPATGLKDQQSVTVTNSGIPSSAGQLQLRECNTVYAAAHGYNSGCDQLGNVQRGAQNIVPVFDGPSGERTYACNYANNGDCALVILSSGSSGGSALSEVASYPISFRPPVLGPATIAATPTTGLHDGAAGSMSVKTVPDGVDEAALIECRPSAINGFSGDWEYRACAELKRINVVNNSFPRQAFNYHEGGVGGEGTLPCDHSHPCEIGLSARISSTKDRLLSNWVPISFRKANFGTPTMTLSKHKRLEKGDKIKLAVTDVPDLVRSLGIVECNLKGGYDPERCVGLKVKPSGETGPIVKNNKVHGATTIKVGAVGVGRNGKKVYCNADTNGQCALVATAYPGYKYLLKSRVIKFAKS